MTRSEFAGSLGTTIALAPRLVRASGSAPQFTFRSNFWVNLHHRLYQTADWADARKQGYHIFGPGTALLGTSQSLPAPQRRMWDDAVESYRRTYIATRKDLLFDDGLERANASLSDAPEHHLPNGLPSPMSAALESTAAIYRTHLWPGDDRVNRAWIAELEPRAATFGDPMQRRLTHVYDTPWPAKPFRVDVARYAYRFGAYTNVDVGFVHTVMESGDPRLQGLSAAEMLYHEASHAVVFPDEGTIGAEILAAAKRAGAPEPDQFWHAVIFYSAGAVAEETFATRGHAYRTYADVNGLFGPRNWPSYRKPLQAHWRPYIDRGGDLRAAVDRCVAALFARA